MELAGDELHLHFAYPDQISEPGLLKQYSSLLTEAELTRMSGFHFEQHRHQYLVTRALVRSTLTSYFQVLPKDWNFVVNRYGKPEISAPETGLPIRFNLSHTNGLVVLGLVLNRDIGVDIEDMQRPTDSTYVGLSRYFSKKEIESLYALSISQQRQRFFEYWTLKEAYIKARGLGLSIPLHKFSFIFENNKLTGFNIDPDLDDDACKWKFWRMQVDGNYLVAVALESTHTAIELRAVHSVPLRCCKPITLDLL